MRPRSRHVRRALARILVKPVPGTMNGPGTLRHPGRSVWLWLRGEVKRERSSYPFRHLPRVQYRAARTHRHDQSGL